MPERRWWRQDKPTCFLHSNLRTDSSIAPSRDAGSPHAPYPAALRVRQTDRGGSLRGFPLPSSALAERLAARRCYGDTMVCDIKPRSPPS